MNPHYPFSTASLTEKHHRRHPSPAFYGHKLFFVSPAFAGLFPHHRHHERTLQNEGVETDHA